MHILRHSDFLMSRDDNQQLRRLQFIQQPGAQVNIVLRLQWLKMNAT